MKRKTLLALVMVFAASVFAACSGTAPAAGTVAGAAATSAGAAQPAPAADPNAPLRFLFADFPASGTKAKPDEYVLCPPQKFIVEMSQGGGKKNPGTSYLTAKMVAPGATESEVKSLYTSGAYKVPNAYLVTIPYAQKAAVGDVVLTWWQSGSGMQRAIVTDASNPSEPTVRYL